MQNINFYVLFPEFNEVLMNIEEKSYINAFFPILFLLLLVSSFIELCCLEGNQKCRSQEVSFLFLFK